MEHTSDRAGSEGPIYGTEEDPSLELERDRQANDERLKGRFEHIFRKYGQDFEDVGDEIDLQTGEVVVDNGHLSGMRHEVDPGQAPASRFMLDFAASLEEQEGEDGSSDDDGNSTQDTESGSEGRRGDNAPVIDPRLKPGGPSVDAELSRSGAQHERQFTAPGSTGKRPRLSPSLLIAAQEETQSSIEGDSGDAASETHAQPTLLQQLPSLQESMKTLQARAKEEGSVDPDAINALGQSIAKQIADFMAGNTAERAKKGKKRSRDTMWDFPELPESKKPKRQPAQPPTTRSMRDKAFPTSPGNEESIWAAPEHPKFIRPRRKVMEARAKLPYFTPGIHGEQQAAPQNDDGGALREQLEAAVAATGRKGCVNCGITVSPSWRSGPGGASNLCNACGMYWYRYGLLKPLDRLRYHQEAPEEEISNSFVEGNPSPNVANIGRRVSGSTSSTRHTRFTLDEDMLLIKFKEIDNLSWEAMSKHLGGRSSHACQGRYSKKLFDRPGEARDALVEQGYVFPDYKGGAAHANAGAEFYSRDEDELLVQLRDGNSFGWDQVAALLPERSRESVEQRYLSLKGESTGGTAVDVSVAPLKRKRNHTVPHVEQNDTAPHSRYTVQDDVLIKKLREEDGLSWEAIQVKIPGRTALSMQKRYKRDIEGKILPTLPNPSAKPDRADEEQSIMLAMKASLPESATAPGAAKSSRRYTSAEDEALIWMREVKKATWPQVARAMRGRTFDGVRNRYQILRPESTKPKPPTRASHALAGPEGETGIPTEVATPLPANLRLPPADFTPGSTASASKFYSEEEDSMLVELRDERQLSWDIIARYFPTRSANALQQRYATVLGKKRDGEHQDVPAPALRQMLAYKTLHPNPPAKGVDMEAVETTPNAATQAVDEGSDGSLFGGPAVGHNSPSHARHATAFATPAKSTAQGHPYFAPPPPAPMFRPASQEASINGSGQENSHRRDLDAEPSDQTPHPVPTVAGKLRRPRRSSDGHHMQVHNETANVMMENSPQKEVGHGWSDLIIMALSSAEDQIMTVAQMTKWMQANLEYFRKEYSDYTRELSLKSTLRNQLRHKTLFVQVADSMPIKWTFSRSVPSDESAIPQGFQDLQEQGAKDSHDDFCSACNGGGEVVCCDGCNRCFHADCHAPPIPESALQSDDAWHCHVCVEDQRLANGDLTLGDAARATTGSDIRLSGAGSDGLDAYDPSLISTTGSSHMPQLDSAVQAGSPRPSAAQPTSDVYRDPTTSSPMQGSIVLTSNQYDQASKSNPTNLPNADTSSSSPPFYSKHGVKPCNSCTTADVHCDGRKPCTSCFRGGNECSLAPRTYGGHAGNTSKRRLVQYQANARMTPSKATLDLLESYSRPTASPATVPAKHAQVADPASGTVDESNSADPSAAPDRGTPCPRSLDEGLLATAPSDAWDIVMEPVHPTVEGNLLAKKGQGEAQGAPMLSPEKHELIGSSKRRERASSNAVPETPSHPAISTSAAEQSSSRTNEDASVSIDNLEEVALLRRGNAPMVPRMIASSPKEREEATDVSEPAIDTSRAPSSSNGSTPDEIPAKVDGSRTQQDEPSVQETTSANARASASQKGKKTTPASASNPKVKTPASAPGIKKAKQPNRRKSTLNTREAPLPRRHSNVKTVRNGKNASTPVKDVEGSEDELA
ncbi:hypothetical protein MBLNU230_g4981t1 [Neophaeotheca triangularis]